MRFFKMSNWDECDWDNTWGSELQDKHECPGCRAFDRALRACGVDVRVDRRPRNLPLHSARGIGIIRRDFLSQIEEQLLPQISVGRVVDRHGQELSDFATFIPHIPFVVRSREPVYRTCEVCGRFVYTPVGDPYVLGHTLDGRTVYCCDWGGLIIRDDVRLRLGLRPTKIRQPKHCCDYQRGIVVEELPILEHPLDGIDPFPENYY
jgi:hypothetical protein